MDFADAERQIFITANCQPPTANSLFRPQALHRIRSRCFYCLKAQKVSTVIEILVIYLTLSFLASGKIFVRIARS